MYFCKKTKFGAVKIDKITKTFLALMLNKTDINGQKYIHNKINSGGYGKMKFITGFLAGGAIACGAIMMMSPSNMRKARRRYKCAKRMIKNMGM